jgi:hypothetical protein
MIATKFHKNYHACLQLSAVLSGSYVQSLSKRNIGRQLILDVTYAGELRFCICETMAGKISHLQNTFDSLACIALVLPFD